MFVMLLNRKLSLDTLFHALFIMFSDMCNVAEQNYVEHVVMHKNRDKILKYLKHN